MPKVSVIIPVYNVEEYLPKCLDSLTNQTLEDIEIILVNDGSPDNSEKIIKKYQKKDKRIVYIKKENGGQGSARNLGLTNAKGEYISFVDSDDYIELDMMEKMYDEASKNNLDVVICGYKNINNEKIENYYVSKDLIQDTLDNKNSKIFNTISPWSKIYNREFLLKTNIKFIEEKLWYEDLPYSIKILSQTNKIGFVNEPLYNYLIRENSTMNNNKLLKNLDLIVQIEDVIEFMKDNNLWDEFSSEIEFVAINNILISGITRIIRANGNKKIKKEVIKRFLDYMNTNFSNYKENKYLGRLSKNKKIIYKLICLKQYFLVRLIFKIKN